MKITRKTLPIMLIFVLCGLVFGQNDEKKMSTYCGSGIIIGRAKSLPKPSNAWTTCDCKYEKSEEFVSVQIEIEENGNVTSATTVSGHPFLRANAEAATRNSKFSPTIFNGKFQKTYSELTYTFNITEGEVSVLESPLKFLSIPLGNLNDKAISLPMPKRPFGNYRVAEDSKIGVEVKTDLHKGIVVEAKGSYGFPLFKKPAEDAALLAKFDFSKSNLPAKFGTGILWYKVDDFIKPNESLVSDKEIIDKSQTYSFCVVNGKSIHLPKPEYPQIAKALRAAGEVQVQVIIDKKGIVIKAKVVKGHPLLRENSIKAAFKSTFEPVKLSGKPVKVTGVIVYKFML
jgi:TonB family protein